MKGFIKKNLLFLSLVFMVIFTSCRSEDDLSIDPPIDANIEANSMIAQLMGKVALNDGSKDNIIDGASNLSVQLPITVTVNGTVIEVTDSDGYDEILDNFNISDTDDDVVNISYPITVIFPNYTMAVVNSDTELNDLTVNSDNDDDIECIDFEYPITVSVFNENSDTVTAITINNDNQLYNFIEDLDEFAAVTINFPITVVLADGSTQVINTIQELEETIEAADGTCDEDDDNDFYDNCNGCTIEELEAALLQCQEWSVDKLRRNNNVLEDLYVNYIFTFNNDNTITVVEDGSTIYNGTWQASNVDDDLFLDVNVTGLSDFNDNWGVVNINMAPVEKKIELRLGVDRLRFDSTCENDPVIDDTALVSVLTTGDWYVNYFFENIDDTADYVDYVFNFGTDNTATAMDMSGTVNGTWATAAGDQTELALNLDFGTGAPLDRLAQGWDVLESTTDIIRLQYSDGVGPDVFLNFGRTPFDPTTDDTCEANTYTTSFFEDSMLACGNWTIDKLRRNNNVLEDNYVDYVFTFNGDGTILVTENTNTFNGTWQATGTEGDVDVTINVTGLPDFNDTWNLCKINLQPTEKQVELKIGTDRLRFGSSCSDGTTTDLDVILEDGLWVVASYSDNGIDETGDYSGYEINFINDGTVLATDGINTNNGTWSVFANNRKMNIDFGTEMPFQEFNNNNWDVLSISNNQVTIYDISGGGTTASADIITLQKL